MTRGLYIMIAVTGLVLMLLAGLAALVSVAPPRWAWAAGLGEATAGIVGLGMAWGGLLAARTASEFGVGRARSPRRRKGAGPAADPVPGTEVAFDCPGCGRTYRATAAMAGRPFACRVCDARFTVPRPA